MNPTEFQLVDHGIEHEQYFQGCGVAFTPYSHCATGCGDNPREALDDLLTQIAFNFSYDIEKLEQRILRHIKRRRMPTRPNAKGENHYYYMSLRWND